MPTQSTKITRVCEHCSTTFTRPISQTGKGRGRFCSRTCSNRSRPIRSPKTPCVCRTCGNPFAVHPSQIRSSGGGRFCSRTCRHGGDRAKVPRICEFCGAVFHAWPSIVKQGRGRFCSKPCASRFMTVPLADRFRNRLAPPDERGCVLWIGGLDERGYGRIHESTRPHRAIGAHRVAWEIVHGPIEDDLCVLHRCDVPACVNVDHLFLGTRADNNADKVAKGRQSRCAKLNDSTVRVIRARAAAGATWLELADEFGVGASAIADAVNRKTWRHVSD